MRREFAFQSSRNGCGYASVKNAIYFTVLNRRDILFAPEPKIEGNRSPSLEDIINYGKSLGCSLGASRLLDKNDIASNKEFPLLGVVNVNRSLHLLLVLRKKRGKFILIDPELGRYSIHLDEFISIFTGIILRVEEYQDLGIRYSHEKILPLSRQFIMAGLSILPIISLACGVYLLSNEEVPAFISVSLFFLFLIFSLVDLNGKSLFLKNFDKKYLKCVDSENVLERKENLEHYNFLKGSLFSTIPIFLCNVLTNAFFSLFLFLEDMFFGVCILIMYAFMLVNFLFIEPSFSKQERQISSMESTYVGTNDLSKEERIALLEEMNSKAMKYSRSVILNQSIIYVFSLGILFLFSFVFYQKLNPSYLIMKSLTLLFLQSMFLKVLTEEKNIKKRRKEEFYFRQHFL